MINKKKIIENYNTNIVEPKRLAASNLKAFLIAGCVIVIAGLLFAFSVAQSSVGLIKVAKSNGQFLETTITTEQKFLRTRIEAHCAAASYYANSFDRMSIQENQSRNKFLMAADDATRVYSYYKTNGGYSDAIDRGFTYKTDFLQVDNVSGDKEPYHVNFSSVLKIFQDGNEIAEFSIKSEGDIISYTPQYPENQEGLYFSRYSQSFTKNEIQNNVPIK
jgi:hypothetical protein